MDGETAGPRIKELRHELAQLETYRDELAASIDIKPTPPPPGTMQRIRAERSNIVATGTPGERKRSRGRIRDGRDGRDIRSNDGRENTYPAGACGGP